MSRFKWDKFLSLEEKPELFTGLKKPYKGFCDEKIPNEYYKQGLAIIREFNKNINRFALNKDNAEEYQKKFQQIEDGDKLFKQILVFSHEENEIIYFHTLSELPLSEWDTPNEMEYILFVTKENFLYIGNSGGHCNTGTKEWVYFNSDGSSPEIMTVKEFNLNTIIDKAKKYYNNCCKNIWH